MNEEDYSEHESRHPKVFLVLASFMVGLAVLSYVFEEWLYDFNQSSATFAFAISISILMALFFLFAYRTPSIGLKLLGRYAVDKSKDVSGITYNVFQGTSPTDEKLRQTRRKHARHLRKQTARVTREMEENKSKD